MANHFTIGKKRTERGTRCRPVDRRSTRLNSDKISMRYVIGPLVFFASALAVQATGEPGIITGSDQFEFVYRVKLPDIKGDARVWLPLAKTDAFQTVTEEEFNIPMKWEKVQDRDYGNDICVLHPQPSDGGKAIELRDRLVRKETR